MSFFDEDYKNESEDQIRTKEILLSTGNINRQYIERDIIFVADRFDDDFFDAKRDPNEALQTIKDKMKKVANSYGANAVIHCHFDHDRVEIDGKKYLDVFAYGTVVQFIQSTIGG